MNKFRISLLTIGILLCVSSYAFKGEGREETRVFNGFATSKETLKLIYQSNTSENILLQISDSEGRILLTKKFKNTSAFNLPVRFEEIFTSEYNINLKIDDEWIKETVRVDVFDSVIDQGALEVGFENGKVDLQSNTVSEENVTVKITDKEGHLLYRDDLGMTERFKRTYDLSQLKGEEILLSAFVKNQLILEESFQL